jgi:hypothetical protein
MARSYLASSDSLLHPNEKSSGRGQRPERFASISAGCSRK